MLINRIKAYIMYALLPLLSLSCTSEVISEEQVEEEMKKTGWAQNGDLTRGSTQKAVRLQAEFEEMGNYTVLFGVQDSYEPGLLEFTRVKGEILWKVKGNQVRRYIDVINGASITGTAEAVEVVVRDASSYLNATPYNVSVLVAKGSRPSEERPVVLTADGFSGQTVLAAGIDSFDVPIPQDAGVISVMVTVAPATIGDAIGAYDILVAHTNSAGSAVKRYDPRQDDWVPIGQAAQVVTCFQGAAAPSTIWSVTFGIDG